MWGSRGAWSQTEPTTMKHFIFWPTKCSELFETEDGDPMKTQLAPSSSIYQSKKWSRVSQKYITLLLIVILFFNFNSYSTPLSLTSKPFQVLLLLSTRYSTFLLAADTCQMRMWAPVRWMDIITTKKMVDRTHCLTLQILSRLKTCFASSCHLFGNDAAGKKHCSLWIKYVKSSCVSSKPCFCIKLCKWSAVTSTWPKFWTFGDNHGV